MIEIQQKRYVDDQEDQSLIQIDMNGLVVSHIPETKQPSKFMISDFEIYLIFPLGMILMAGFFYDIAHKSNLIQEQTPLKGVVKSWFGYYRDDSDYQWREFRKNAPTLIFALSIFNIITYLIKKQKTSNRYFKPLMLVYFTTGIGLLIFLFGIGGFFLWFLFSSTNYLIEKVFGRHRYFPILLWTFSIYSLYYNYFYKDEPFLMIKVLNNSIGEYLHQSYKDSLVPWNMVYNMTILRIISYCLDKHWAFMGKYKFDTTKHLIKCELCSLGKICYKARSEQYLEPFSYNSILNYYAYLSYVPLFITGPQITYNAFISQVYNNQKSLSNGKVLFYVLRAINNLFILELYTHSNFSSALSKISQNKEHWINFSASQCLFMGFLNLIFIWLKFLSLWRLSRAFALLDGIDSPENMNRCIMNNYCFEGFWRSWHRGFNQWLIRYIFIPLGGSRTKFWNIWVVFTFVAIWHDIELNLVIWAWFICAALIPEMVVKNWADKQIHLWQKHWFTQICSLVATIYIWLMTVANLIGFGNGYQNILIVIEKFSEPGGLYELIPLFAIMYPLTIYQFWLRNKESNNNQAQGF